MRIFKTEYGESSYSPHESLNCFIPICLLPIHVMNYKFKL